MAIVLEVSLTLNPVNQIAYLADFTGLVVGTEYVIKATYLPNDTRFTFHGNLDITLTRPPQGVPGPGTIVPAEVQTVPMAATPPAPVTYPFSTKDRLDASNLNATFEFDPAPVPPHSALGGAGRYKFWVDTSTTPATLRQCVAARAATTYNAAEWVTVGTVDGSGFKFPGYLPLTGGTLTGQLNIQPASGWSGLNLYYPGSGQAAYIQGISGNNLRWGLYLGNTAPETGGNVGSDFVIARYADNGAGLGTPLQITRSTGLVSIGSLALSTPLPVASGGTGSTTVAGSPYLPLSGGTINGGLTTTGNIQAPGIHVTNNVVVDGPLSAGSVSAGSATISGTLNAGGTTLTGLTVNGGSGFNGAVTITGNLLAGNTTVAALTMSQGTVNGLFGVTGLTTLNTLNVNGNAHFIGACQVDHGVQYPAYGLANAATNIGFGYSYNTPTVLWLVANDSFVGTILVNTSDERLKRNIQPITVDPLASLRRVQLKTFNQVSARNVPADVAQHRDVGFIAQQLREVVPDAVIEPPADMPGDGYLSVDITPLVAYCIGAIQQLAARLEALEDA